MSGEYAWLIIGLVVLGLYALILLISTIVKRDDLGETPTRREAPRRTVYSEQEDPRYLEERQQQAFWTGAYHYLQQFSLQYDIDAIHEFALNVWNDKDHKKYAQELHQFLDHAIEFLYKHRHVDGCKEYILELGSLAISIFPDALKSFGYPSICARYANRMAIILEKDERYEEALALCEHCYHLGIQDYHANRTFSNRIQHLKNKVDGK